MKILHVNDYREGGGAEVVIARTIKLQRERGHEVELFTIDDVPKHRRTWRTYLNNRRAARALEGRLAAFAPDVVHVHNYYHELSPAILEPLRSSRRPRGCRVLMTAHDYHLLLPNSGGYIARGGRLTPVDPVEERSLPNLLRSPWDHRGRRFSILKAVQHASSYRSSRQRQLIPDAILCPSRELRDALRLRNLMAMFVPYPSPAFMPTHERPNDLTFVFAGRIEREKGLAECIAIWPRDFADRLRIVGDGSERERCERIVHERGLTHSIEFLGRLPHEQALMEMRRAHVLLLPTRCIEVGQHSIHEALSMGTNILVPDHGDCAAIVEATGVGVRFALDDEDSLAAALGAIRKSFIRGDLNAFDLTAYFADRSESKYIERLERICQGLDPWTDEASSGSATLPR